MCEQRPALGRPCPPPDERRVVGCGRHRARGLIEPAKAHAHGRSQIIEFGFERAPVGRARRKALSGERVQDAHELRFERRPAHRRHASGWIAGALRRTSRGQERPEIPVVIGTGLRPRRPQAAKRERQLRQRARARAQVPPHLSQLCRPAQLDDIAVRGIQCQMTERDARAVECRERYDEIEPRRLDFHVHAAGQ